MMIMMMMMMKDSNDNNNMDISSASSQVNPRRLQKHCTSRGRGGGNDIQSNVRIYTATLSVISYRHSKHSTAFTQLHYQSYHTDTLNTLRHLHLHYQSHHTDTLNTLRHLHSYTIGHIIQTLLTLYGIYTATILVMSFRHSKHSTTVISCRHSEHSTTFTQLHYQSYHTDTLNTVRHVHSYSISHIIQTL